MLHNNMGFCCADEDCCRGLAAFWGPNSTLPSRNCFCAKAVWEEFKAYEEQH
jgi:hypothetical protein